MDHQAFIKRFNRSYSRRYRYKPTLRYGFGPMRRFLDPCPDVLGMTALKNQRLLRLAFASIPEGEAYLEVGTFQGKSLISAATNQPPRPVYACDSFTEFTDDNSPKILERNLRNHGLDGSVRFFDADFRDVLTSSEIAAPVGLYYYDGAHDEQAQYEGIVLAERLLADQAVVVVDDWRHAHDSGSFAEEGTRRAIAESVHEWHEMSVLPARRNGDLEMWWNGVAVFGFTRRHEGQTHKFRDTASRPDAM